jgi:hypothetical protein
MNRPEQIDQTWSQRGRAVARDFLTFIEILSFWPLAFCLLLPLTKLDERCGTKFAKPLVKLVKYIANL